MVSGRLFGLFTRESSSRVDNSTLGAHRLRKDNTDTAGMRSTLMDGDISLDGFSDQDQDEFVTFPLVSWVGCGA